MFRTGFVGATHREPFGERAVDLVVAAANTQFDGDVGAYALETARTAEELAVRRGTICAAGSVALQAGPEYLQTQQETQQPQGSAF